MEHNVDELLALFINMAERKVFSTSITLQMHGMLVGGQLVSTREHTAGLRDSLRAASGAGAQSVADGFDRAVQRESSAEQADISEEDPRFVHLRDATIILSNGTTFRTSWWAGCVDAIDGWFLGAHTAA